MREPFYYLTSPVSDSEAPVRTFAIGKFDGLHIAHQTVIKSAVRVGEMTGSSPCVFTFNPHPRFVLTGDPAYQMVLTPPAERSIVAKGLGIEEVFVANFDDAFRSQSAEEFLSQYLLPLGARHLVVGYNFRFGKNGATNAAGLVHIAGEMGLSVDVVELVDDHGQPVSSTRIRMHLECGDAQAAAKLLGRPYRIRATVVQGDARGRTIGFPTANLFLKEPYVYPKVGVYIVDVHVSGNLYRGMMNLGYRPTVNLSNQLAFEVHLIDFEGDLYGQELIVDILQFLREEIKFPSLLALKEQLRKDRDFARSWTNF